MNVMARFVVLLFAATLAAGCFAQSNLKDFASDGCSLFPDGNLILGQDWCMCCFEHDIAYWKGGTQNERLLADMALRDCVLKQTGNRLLADSIFQGVRLGGSPYFYNWYRWGYGWSYERKYKPLTHDEKIEVQKKLEKFFSEHGTAVCR